MRLPSFVVIGTLALLPTAAVAQLDPHLIPTDGTIAGCSFVTGNFTWACIPMYVAYLIQTVFGFIGTLCLIQIIWAGYEIAIRSLSGDKEAGKNRLFRALMGLAFSLFVYLIVDMVVSVVL